MTHDRSTLASTTVGGIMVMVVMTGRGGLSTAVKDKLYFMPCGLYLARLVDTLGFGWPAS